MFKRDVLSAMLKRAVDILPFEELSRLLPFQTRIVSGSTLNHLQSRHAFDIETRGRYSYMAGYVIRENDTLCRRSDAAGYLTHGYRLHTENCPGCTAIAQGLIKRDIENA